MDRDTTTNPAAHRAFDRPVASQYHATTPAILDWFRSYNSSRPVRQQVRPFNFLLAFQAHPFADKYMDSGAPKLKKQLRETLTGIAKPVAAFDRNTLRAARNCFDRSASGRRIPFSALETYREALAQYHLYPKSKFINGKHRDRGPTKRRHIVISLSDVHYLGKETNDLDEQVFLGFDPEAQPEYGMEGEAYAKLSTDVRHAMASYDLEVVSKATGVSTRYLRKIRDGLGNPTVRILQAIAKVIPDLEAYHAKALLEERSLLDWASAERDRIGLRPLAVGLRTDPANLAKVLRGSRRASHKLMTAIRNISKGS